jgi:hypothetical protein
MQQLEATQKRPVVNARQPLAEWLVGDWLSGSYESPWEPMRFEFHFGKDGRFVILGKSSAAPYRQLYERRVEYTLEGNRFFSDAINGGSPVRLRRDGDELLFMIDETLSLRLTRLSAPASK